MKQKLKKAGYLLFACFFYIYRVFTRVNKYKVFCIMTHDSSMDSNVGMIVQQMKKDPKYIFYYIKKEDTENVKGIHTEARKKGKLHTILSFFLVKPYQMATAKYIFLDNVFLPMSYLHFSKKTRVVQLWHGTGTIKKFGQDSNEGVLKKLEMRANNTITHLIVNSEELREQYAGAFGISIDKVYATGLPRTDTLFDEVKKKRDVRDFYDQYPELKHKKLVLYAPTFRDSEVAVPKMRLDLDMLVEQLPDDCVCMIKLHPFVEKHYRLTQDQVTRYNGKIMNMSSYTDTNTLLLVSDALITDYSSIIFEYCLSEKPMIFFAYDLENFTNQGRGFYEPYEDFVPGMIVKSTYEVVEAIKLNVYEGKYDLERIEWFCDRHYDHFDGCSTSRVIELVTQDTH